MTERDASAFDLGWRLVSMTLEGLAALTGLAAGFLWSRDFARASAELRLGEQTARRLIIAEAGRMMDEGEVPARVRRAQPAPLPTHAPQPKSGPTQAPSDESAAALGAHAAAPPTFAIFEPLGEIWPAPPTPEALAALKLAAGKPQVPRSTHGLSRRIAALQAVLDDPGPAARRMARFLAGGGPRRSRRASPFRPGYPPAYRRAAYLEWPTAVLVEAHEAAMRALNTPRAPPPNP
ncbi:MAG: hypothetical protein AAGH87_05280 [Pseudomonadota bacterium]